MPFKNQIIISLFFGFFFLNNLNGETNHLFYGKKALAEKNYPLALELFTKELKNNPLNCEAHFYKGVTLEKINQKEQAISSFLFVTKINCNPKLKEQSFWKAFNYYKFLEDWDTLYEVSKAFLQFKPNPEVEKYYKIAEENRNPKTTKLKELSITAEKYESTQNWDKAVELYREIFDLTQEVQYLLKIALIYKNIKNDKDAYNTFLEILKYEPKHWYANYQLGIYSFSFGYPENCIQYLDVADKNNKDRGSNFLYYVNLTKALCNLNLEQYLDFKENFLFLKNLKHNKEENFYLLELFYNFFINLDYKINYKKTKISRHLEGFHVLQMLEAFYQKDFNQLFHLLTSLDFKNTKYIRWSNYIKQLYLILLIEFRGNQEKRNLILNLLQEENFLEITTKPYKKSLLIYFLQNYTQKPYTKLDKKFLEQLFFSELDPFSLSLVYLYYLQKEKEEFVRRLNQLPNLENAFLYYLKSIRDLYQKDAKSAYTTLMHSIELDIDFKDIAVQEGFFQEYLEENDELKNL